MAIICTYVKTYFFKIYLIYENDDQNDFTFSCHGNQL